MNPDWLDGLAGLDGRNSSLDNNEMRLISLLLIFIRLQFSWTISIDESIQGLRYLFRLMKRLKGFIFLFFL